MRAVWFGRFIIFGILAGTIAAAIAMVALGEGWIR